MVLWFHLFVHLPQIDVLPISWLIGSFLSGSCGCLCGLCNLYGGNICYVKYDAFSSHIVFWCIFMLQAESSGIHPTMTGHKLDCFTSWPWIMIVSLLFCSVEMLMRFHLFITVYFGLQAFLYSLENEIPLIAFCQDRCFTLFDHPLVDSLHTTYHEPKVLEDVIILLDVLFWLK